MQKSVCRSSEQQKRASDSSDDAGDGERHHHTPRDIEMLPVSARTGRDADPQGDGVGGVRGNRRNACEHQRRKRNETAATGDRIECSAQYSGNEEEDVGVKVQVKDVSQQKENSPVAASRFSACVPAFLCALCGLFSTPFCG